jgi:hypothetical protein
MAGEGLDEQLIINNNKPNEKTCLENLIKVI